MELLQSAKLTVQQLLLSEKVSLTALKCKRSTMNKVASAARAAQTNRTMPSTVLFPPRPVTLCNDPKAPKTWFDC
eukprot:5834498-Amphidinium_carterae.3